MAATKRAGGRSGSGSGSGTKAGGAGTGSSGGASERPRLRSSHASGSAKRGTADGPSASRRPIAKTGKPAKAGKPEGVAARGVAKRANPGRVERAAAREEIAARNVPRPRRLEPTTPPVSSGPRGKKVRGPAGAAPPSSLASDRSRALAIAIAIAALDKKAVGLEILDVAGRVDYADFLVLMTGRSDRQVVALAQGIEEALRKEGTRPLSIEGLPHASWVLMDFGDVVVHVFQDEARSLYDLEGLWMDARRVAVPVPEELRS